MGKGKTPRFYTFKEEKFNPRNNNIKSEESIIDSMINDITKVQKGEMSAEKASRDSVKKFDEMITNSRTVSPINMDRYKLALSRGQESLYRFLDNQLFNIFFLVAFQIYIDYNFSKDSAEYIMLHRYIKNRMCYPLEEDEFEAMLMGFKTVKAFYLSLLDDIFNNNQNLEV